MQYPNGRYFNASPGRFFGGTTEGFLPYSRMRGDRLNRFINANWSRIHGGLPSGYGVRGIVPAIRAGGVSAFDSDSLTLTTAATVNIGAQISGSATLSISETANLTLLANMLAADALALAVANATLGGLIALVASDTLTSTLTGTITATGDVAGTDTLALIESVTLTASGNMVGVISAYTELSPENLALAAYNLMQPDLSVINTGVQKASVLIPHTTNL